MVVHPAVGNYHGLWLMHCYTIAKIYLPLMGSYALGLSIELIRIRAVFLLLQNDKAHRHLAEQLAHTISNLQHWCMEI